MGLNFRGCPSISCFGHFKTGTIILYFTSPNLIFSNGTCSPSTINHTSSSLPYFITLFPSLIAASKGLNSLIPIEICVVKALANSHQVDFVMKFMVLKHNFHHQH